MINKNDRQKDQVNAQINERNKRIQELESLLNHQEKNVENLKKSTSIYKSIIQNMTHGYAYHKIIVEDGIPCDYEFLEVNRAFEKLTGLKGENILGKKVTEVLPGIENAAADWIGVYGKVTLGNPPIKFEQYAELLKKWYSITAFCPEKGYFVTIFSDISKQVEERTQLKKLHTYTHQQTHDLGEQVKELTCLYELSKLLDDPFRSLEEVFQQVLALIPPAWQYPDITCAKIIFDEKKSTTDNFKETTWKQSANITISGKKAGSIEVYYLEEMPELYEGPFSKEERNLINGLARELAEFITRKQTEEALHQQTRDLRESEERYRELFNNMSSGVAVYEAIDGGMDFKFKDFNKTGERIENISRDELIGKSVIEKFPGVKEFGLFEVFQRVWKTGKPEHYPISLYEDERIAGWRDNFVYKLPSREIVAIYDDVTEQKKLEEELKQTVEELERSNVELEQFAYVASHDLQEPLRIITSFIQLLAKRYKDKLDSEAQEYIDYIVDGANRMYQLINDLLAFSRITRGKRSQSSDVSDIITQAMDNLQLVIEAADAEITTGSFPEDLVCDPSQICQVFQNLIENAVKFRREETPSIQISAKKLKTNWKFSIKDNGIGIEKQYFDRIFVIFQRLHTRKEYSGTGIGLAICKRIINHHGGRIWVKSKSGKGSTFHFTIPHKKGIRQKLINKNLSE